MPSIIEVARGGVTTFMTPNSDPTKTATVNGVSATIASQNTYSVTLSVAPTAGQIVAIAFTAPAVVAPGGGAAAFTDLSDKSSVDIVAINAPLSASLAAVGVGPLVPIAVASNRALTSADAAAPLVVTGSITLTVPASFMRKVSAKGTVTFAAAGGVTVTDVRTTGATDPWCELIPRGTDLYDVVGAKA